MFMLPKSLAEFASADAKAVQSVFCRDMCVAENTLREASVELSAFSGQFDTHFVRSIFSDVHAAGENVFD